MGLLPGLLQHNVPRHGPVPMRTPPYRVPRVALCAGLRGMAEFWDLSGIWASCRYNEKSYMCVHKNILYASKRAEATCRLHVQSR